MDDLSKLSLLLDLESALHELPKCSERNTPVERFMIFITAKAMGVSPILLRKWVECDFGELGSGMHVTVGNELVKNIRDNESFVEFVGIL